MNFNISASYIIDEMIALMDEADEYLSAYKRQFPHGQYVTDETPYGNMRNYSYYEKAEAKIFQLECIFRDYDLDAAAKQTKKWYEETEWQLCLTNEMAEDILKANCKAKAYA